MVAAHHCSECPPRESATTGDVPLGGAQEAELQRESTALEGPGDIGSIQLNPIKPLLLPPGWRQAEVG